MRLALISVLFATLLTVTFAFGYFYRPKGIDSSAAATPTPADASRRTSEPYNG